ncbi:MAG: hypothetical protein AAF609_01775 [Cyanobacteria bacterium P01_C01_bin.120]
MKRFLLSTLTILLTMGALTAAAGAEQVGLTDSRADLNGDGKVTLHEVKSYNRDQRQA